VAATEFDEPEFRRRFLPAPMATGIDIVTESEPHMTDTPSARTTDPRPGNLVWSWRNAAFGAVISTVAVIVIVTGNVEDGLYLLIGAIPAAILGLPPHRKDRRKVIIIGALFAVSVMVGSILAQWAAVAVVGMFLMGLGAALLATRKELGYAVLTICLPLAATGLTYDGLDESVGVSALFVIGSAIAFLGALCFPEYQAPPPAEPPLLTIAAALATAIGFSFGAEHTGWIVISTLLVMRPTDDMMKLRSAGRAISVFIGAVVAAWLLTQDLSPAAIAVVGAGAIISAAATNASRWYITPAFTTFLILWCVLYANNTSQNITHRSTERVFDTLLGVGIAYFFGLVVPKLIRNHADTRSTTPSGTT
jgi:hypothetical protein